MTEMTSLLSSNLSHLRASRNNLAGSPRRGDSGRSKRASETSSKEQVVSPVFRTLNPPNERHNLCRQKIRPQCNLSMKFDVPAPIPGDAERPQPGRFELAWSLRVEKGDVLFAVYRRAMVQQTVFRDRVQEVAISTPVQPAKLAVPGATPTAEHGANSVKSTPDPVRRGSGQKQQKYGCFNVPPTVARTQSSFLFPFKLFTEVPRSD